MSKVSLTANLGSRKPPSESQKVPKEEKTRAGNVFPMTNSNMPDDDDDKKHVVDVVEVVRKMSKSSCRERSEKEEQEVSRRSHGD